MRDMSDFPCIQSVGIDGLLVSFADKMSDEANRAAIAYQAALDAAGWQDVLETAPTLVSVWLRVDPLATDFPDLRARLLTLAQSRDWSSAPVESQRQLWHVPTVFGGARAPQLEEAASLAGRTAEEAIADITTTRVRVLTLGFAPGQPYLGLLPVHWNIPRQTGLTRAVPACSLVAAVRQFCLFTTESPTGWRHVGQTAFHCYQPEAAVPMPLRPGDEMQFFQVSEADLSAIEASGDPMGGAEVEPLV